VFDKCKCITCACIMISKCFAVSFMRCCRKHSPTHIHTCPPTHTGHRDRFAVSRGAPGPGAYTPVGFANPANHPTPARTWMHDAVPLNELHWHLKESSMKPDPGTYKVLGDPGALKCRVRLYLVHFVCFESGAAKQDPYVYIHVYTYIYIYLYICSHV